MEDWTYIELSVSGTIRVRGIDRAALYESYDPKTVLQTLYNDGTDLEVTVSGKTKDDDAAISAGRQIMLAKEDARKAAKLERRKAIKEEAARIAEEARILREKKEAELAERARRKAAKRGEEPGLETDDLPIVGPAMSDEEAERLKMESQQVEVIKPKPQPSKPSSKKAKK